MRIGYLILLLLLVTSCGGVLGLEETVVAAKPVLIDGKYHTIRVVYITSPSYEEYPETYAGMRVEIVSSEGTVTASMAFDTSSTDFPASPDMLVNGNTVLLLGIPFAEYVHRYEVTASAITETTTATDKTLFPVQVAYDTLLLVNNAYAEQLWYCPFSGRLMPETELITREDTAQTRSLFFLVSHDVGSSRARLFHYQNECAADTSSDAVRFIGSVPGSTYGFDSTGLAYYMQQHFRPCERATMLLDGKYLEHVFIHAQDENMVLCSEGNGGIVKLVAYSREGKVLWNFAFNDMAAGAMMPGSGSTIVGNTIVIAFNASQYMVLDKSNGTTLTSYY